MGVITGARTVEIDAPIDRVYDIAADIERAPEWQGSMKTAEVVERDDQGRPSLVQTIQDGKVRQVKSLLRFTYHPTERIEWVQEKGDTKSVRGWWDLEDLGGRVRATYNLEVDPGRTLGMLVRGPVVDKVRDFLLAGAAEGLKRRAEDGAT